MNPFSRFVFFLACMACGSGDPAPGKVVVVGLDGLELSLVRTLAADGTLPNFSKLFSEGVAGELETIEPMLSPAIWTTIASGYLPDVHGVSGWISKNGRLSSAADVKSYRVWDVLSQQRKTSLVSGWLMTTPAMPLQGLLLSDRLVWNMSMDSSPRNDAGETLQAGQLNTHIEGITYPAQLIQFAQQWVPTEADLVASPLRYQLQAYGVARHPMPKDETHLRAFEALWGEQHLGLLYLFSGDQISHLYWPFVEAEAVDQMRRNPSVRQSAYAELRTKLGHENDRRAFPWIEEPIEPHQLEEGQRWVPDTYRWLDQALGRVMAKIDSSTTTLIVLSDHGFQKANHLVVLDANHKNPGAFLAWGRGVRKEPVVSGAHVIQIAPTLLRLLGLPVATDMAESVGGVFNYPKAVARRESYAQLPVLAERPEQDPAALKAQLRAIGYLE